MYKEMGRGNGQGMGGEWAENEHCREWVRNGRGRAWNGQEWVVMGGNGRNGK